MFNQEDLSSKPELFRVWEEALDISCIKNQIATDVAEVMEMGIFPTAQLSRVKLASCTRRRSTWEPWRPLGVLV